MKRYITYFIFAIAIVLMATSCEKDVINFHSSKEGGFSLDLKINNTELVTRANLTPEQITALAPTVNIYKPNFEGLIRSYIYGSTGDKKLPEIIYLPAGEGYRVDVLAGEVSKSTPRKANFDTKSYQGSATFDIVADPNNTTAVAVEAKIVNAITKVSFAESIAENFEKDSYTLTVALSEADLASEANANRKLVYDASNVANTTNNQSGEGYFIIDDIKEETSVYWNFQGTLTKDGSTFSASGNFAATTDSDKDDVNDLVAARQNMSFRYDVKDGTLKLGISSDTATDNKEDDITWVPTSTGISTPKPYDIWATHLTLSADVDADQYTGAKLQYREKSTTATTNNWSESFTTTQNTDGTYSATISGLKPNTTYEFRLLCTPKAGGEDVVAGATEDNLDGDLKEIKTAPATQIPNSSFETVGSNTFGLTAFYASDDTKWWDCGNQKQDLGILGSLTVEPTTSTDDVPTAEKVGNNDYYDIGTNSKAVQMQSGESGIGTIKVFGAGNLYSGEYGETRADPSDPSGTVFFGRPWSEKSRPTALRLYVKYESGTITHNATAIPESGFTSDSYDQAQIKIAIGTWDYKKYGSDSNHKDNPILVDTAEKDNIIDYEEDGKTGGGTIAYGNAIIDGQAKTGGNDVYINGEKSSKNYSEWGVITIPLVYYRTNELPTHIVISCASSRFGDYFAGSTASCLKIDGLQLIYDENIVKYQPANN